MYKYIILLISFILTSCGGNNLITKQEFIPPAIKSQPRLLYPKIAQENFYTGSTKVIMIISEMGTVNKVDIAESSDSDILDSAAVRYCRDLVFYPARRNNQPVYSRMQMTIKFDLSEQTWDVKSYALTVQLYYKRLEILKSSLNFSNVERNEIENKILNLHNEFVQNMTDVINFNFYVGQVIKLELYTEWEKDSDFWPLSFLLYHDFIQRSGDYDSLLNVKMRLKNSVKEDIRFIENSAVYTVEEKDGRDKLLQKIKKFIKYTYPDISLEDTDSI